jgi:hypothetical protein
MLRFAPRPPPRGYTTLRKRLRRSGAGIHVVVLLLVTAWTSTSAAGDASAWSHQPYHLGQGLNFAQQNLVVGGYLSLVYSDLEHQDWMAEARDLSLFVSKSLSNRWQLFSEIELGDSLRISADGPSSRHTELDLERLYADYHAQRAVNLRVGKYLTPVGRWNLIHADPLVWTTDRPLTTSAAFARHATGAMLYGEIASSRNSLEYKLYADNSNLLDPSQKNEKAFEDVGSGPSPRNAFKRALGGHLSYHFLNDTAQIGASYLVSKMSDLQDNQELFGTDALVTVQNVELSAEAVYRNSLGSADHDEYGGFVQAVLPLPRRIYLIGRRERYRAALYPPTATIDTAAITYRPHKAVSLKLEYRGGKHNEIVAPTGWLGSLAILF